MTDYAPAAVLINWSVKFYIECSCMNLKSGPTTAGAAYVQYSKSDV